VICKTKQRKRKNSTKNRKKTKPVTSSQRKTPKEAAVVALMDPVAPSTPAAHRVVQQPNDATCTALGGTSFPAIINRRGLLATDEVKSRFMV
jgi:hypothetical protein